jgi:hypothetical protein
VSRLSAVEAGAERLRVQLAAADAAVGEKDATLSLLLADKAYLSKEVQVRHRRCCVCGGYEHVANLPPGCAVNQCSCTTYAITAGLSALKRCTATYLARKSL